MGCDFVTGTKNIHIHHLGGGFAPPRTPPEPRAQGQGPPKKQKKYYIGTILPFWHFLALLGFFLPRITHKKNQKMNILTKFDHFGTSWHCSDFFLPPIPPKNPKNGYFGKIWPFCHFLALFWGGSKLPKKR